MPSISPVEMVVVAILALIVFGPQKLPEIARTVGKTISALRRQADDLRAEFQDGLSFDDQPEPDLEDDDEDEGKPAVTPEPPEAAEAPTTEVTETPAPDKVEDD